MIDNLRKDRTFRPLSRELIDEYRHTLPARQKKYRRPRRRAERGNLPPLDSMPVYVANRKFALSEEAKIRKAHPRWKWFVGWVAPIRTLGRGRHFLEIDAVGRKKRFTVSKYLEHDKVSGAGVIAHVRSGKLFPLEKLAAKLELSQRNLLAARKLDVYGVAIVKRVFPKAFG